MLSIVIRLFALLQPPVDDPRQPVADMPTAVVAPETDPTAMPEPAPTPAVEPAPAVEREPAPASAPVAVAKEPAAKPPARTYEFERKTVPLAGGQYVPGKGFELGTADGRFTLRLRARVQVRYELDHPNAPGENNHQTVQIRRARLQLQGNVFAKHVRYYIQLGFSPRDQIGAVPNEQGTIRRNPLRDARIELDRLRDFTVWAGQMKVPFSRQRVNSSGDLNLVDRSIANEEFNLDRDIGIQALSKDIAGLGWLGYNVGVFAGEGRNAFEPSDTGMVYVARVDVTPLGRLKDDVEGDLERSPAPRLQLAAAYAFHDRSHYDHSTWGNLPDDRGVTDFHNVTSDLMLLYRGLSVQGAFHWRRGFDRRSGGALDENEQPIPNSLPRSGIGWLAQVGYLVPKLPLEIVLRHAGIRNTFGASRSALDWRDEAGGGINYYFAGHNLKLQLDYFRLWGEAQGSSYAAAAKQGNDRVRLQLQLAF